MSEGHISLARGNRKTRSITVGVLAAGVSWLLLAACGGGGSKISSTAQPAAAAAAPTASTAPAPARPTRPLVVAIRNGRLGTILADARDMVLYTYSGDTGGKDGCTASCLKYWPPLLLPAGARAALAGAGVTGLGTVARPDGTQVTFGGKPLYTYAGDTRPGQTNGQGVVDNGGTWYVAVLKGPVAATRTAPASTPPATAPVATHPPGTPAPTMATTPSAPATPAPTMPPATPAPTMAPFSAPPVTHRPTTPAPTMATTPRTTVPATTIPGGGVSY